MIEPKLRISSPSDLVAAVPYLLGFTPTDSLVVVGLQQRRVIFQLRLDIPDVADQPVMAEYVAAVVARQGVTGVLVVGYGSEKMVAPVVDVVRDALDEKDVSVLEMLRVDGGRYWSYVCSSSDCCPAAGTPVDVSSSRVAAEATFAGLTVSGSRDELVARLAPVTGEPRLNMTHATALAEARLGRLLTEHPNSFPESLLIGAGMSAVDAAITTVSDGQPVSDDEVAWLSLLLVNVAVRDYAWDLVGQNVALHLTLWTEVLRRASPDLAAAPATLLAFTAWRSGEGAIATIALERAFIADANYAMAHLLRQAIEGGVSPTQYLDGMASDAGGRHARDGRKGSGGAGSANGRSRGRGRHANRRRYARSK